MAATTEKIKDEVIEKVGLAEEYTARVINWAKDFLPDLAMAILTLLIGLWLIKRIARLAEKAMGKRHLDISLRTFLKSLIGIGLKVVLIIMVAGMVGIQTASFVTILGAAGLAIGLALQGSLSNFAGGVLILIFKPYKVGDTIEAQGQKGDVLEIQIFNTILLTGEHKTVILPNGAVSNGSIINYTRHGNIRVDIDIPVSEKHKIGEVRKIILQTLSGDERILPKPAPAVTCTGFIPNGYVIGVRFYTTIGDKPNVYDDSVEKIQEAFLKHQVEAPRALSYVKTV